MSGFRGKAPGAGSGEMSLRTQALRPSIALDAREQTKARKMRRGGAEPSEIAVILGVPVEEVEKALVQMRSPRPETTRGTLNVTLAAHKMIMQERVGDEPIWQTIDRMLDELLRRRAAGPEKQPARRAKAVKEPEDLPLLSLTKS
jgi:hypothetical protein